MLDFIQECYGCVECTFTGDNKWSLDGGGHTFDECISACKENPQCNYASLDPEAGYCHMTASCPANSGTNWHRFKKIGM